MILENDEEQTDQIVGVIKKNVKKKELRKIHSLANENNRSCLELLENVCLNMAGTINWPGNLKIDFT